MKRILLLALIPFTASAQNLSVSVNCSSQLTMTRQATDKEIAELPRSQPAKTVDRKPALVKYEQAFDAVLVNYTKAFPGITRANAIETLIASPDFKTDSNVATDVQALVAYAAEIRALGGTITEATFGAAEVTVKGGDIIALDGVAVESVTPAISVKP